MEQEYLIDTNSVVDILDNKLPTLSANLIENCINNISVVTKIELLSWQNGKDFQYKILERYISESNIISLTNSIVSETIHIRKSYQLKIPDAIIAAKVYGYTLITRNVKDFELIKDLKILNPHT
jgi:predicted nucleic acid-binding protein